MPIPDWFWDPEPTVGGQKDQPKPQPQQPRNLKPLAVESMDKELRLIVQHFERDKDKYKSLFASIPQTLKDWADNLQETPLVYDKNPTVLADVATMKIDGKNVKINGKNVVWDIESALDQGNLFGQGDEKARTQHYSPTVSKRKP